MQHEEVRLRSVSLSPSGPVLSDPLVQYCISLYYFVVQYSFSQGSYRVEKEEDDGGSGRRAYSLCTSTVLYVVGSISERRRREREGRVEIDDDSPTQDFYLGTGL